jgi:hypothetical protein
MQEQVKKVKEKIEQEIFTKMEEHDQERERSL